MQKSNIIAENIIAKEQYCGAINIIAKEQYCGAIN